MTHYLCLDDECLKKGFVVFKYVAEKELHDVYFKNKRLKIMETATK